MNDISTVPLNTSSSDDSSATASWDESFARRMGSSGGLNNRQLVKGIALAICVFSTSAIQDTWAMQKEESATTTTSSRFVEQMDSRRITRIEALKIARGVLERAENERLKIAEMEASRGIQWEDEE